MRIYLQPPPSQIARDLFAPLRLSLQALGHEVRHVAERKRPGVAVVWNGRGVHGGGCQVFCAENGWLPRSAYQIGLGGFNANHHAAPWRWTGPLSDEDAGDLDEYLELLRSRVEGGAYGYTDPTGEPAGPGEPFLLAPFQMPQDVNMESVPQGLRTPFSFASAVLDASPPWRVVFKQHPMDANHGNDQLSIPVSKGGEVWPHSRANIHQLLKSPDCRGVVTLNSNTAHDALLWGVPVIALGRGMWAGRDEALPEDWAAWEAACCWRQVAPARRAYAHRLIRQQWKPEPRTAIEAKLMRDPGNPEDVAELLEVAR